MAAVRLECVERDRVDARSVVEGLPTAAEIAEASAKLDEPSKNQVLVVRDGSVVGYSTSGGGRSETIRGCTCTAVTSCPSIATRASDQPCCAGPKSGSASSAENMARRGLQRSVRTP